MTLYALGDIEPQIDDTAWVAPNATIIGDVRLAANVSIWWNAVIRADTAPIDIGEGTNIQDGSVLHIDKGIPLTIGKNVTVGHMVMLHGCTIGDNSLVAISATVLNHAVVGKNCIVGAGTLIPEGKTYPDGVMILGTPGRVIRPLTEKEIEYLQYASSHYIENAELYRTQLRQIDI